MSAVLAGAAIDTPPVPTKHPAANVVPIATPGDPCAYSHWESIDDGAPAHRPGVYWVPVVTDRATGAVIGYGDPLFLCSPLEVRAKARDPRSKEWGRLLVFPDPDGVEHRWVCPHDIHGGRGEELRKALLSQGLEITTDRRMRERLGEYIQDQHVDARTRVVRRTGWAGDVYVLPDRTVGDDSREPVLLAQPPDDGIGLGASGTMDGWREYVSRPCAGNSRLVLAVSAAFAGPCLGLLDAEGGGIHMRGESSKGKTTAQEVAASVYGQPRGYKRMWRATDNGLEGTAASHSDMLLILDEIGELDPKHAAQVAYMLANGQGKVRANKDGSPRAVATWRVLFLSSGEIGLADMVTQAGGKVRAGQEVRVIDLPADAGAGRGLFDCVPQGMDAKGFADALKAAAATHYGHALQVFLRALTGGPDAAREDLRESRGAIAAKLAPAGAGDQVRRVADRFALIAAAGELATAHRITGWSAGEATRAAKACFDAWLRARGTAGDAETPAMLAQVRGFLEAGGEARFTSWTAPEAKFESRTANRAGFRKDSANGPTFYIERECFRNEVCKGFAYSAVAAALARAGALETEGDGTTVSKRLPDGRKTRVYVVTPALWNQGEQE